MGTTTGVRADRGLMAAMAFYATGYLLLLVFVGGLLCAYPKLELHLLLNSHHTDSLDTFFKHYSVLAEWPLYVVMLLPLLWKKYGVTLYYGTCEVVAGSFLQLLKHIFNSPRPVSAFADNMVLPLVDGVNMHYSNSFPSGHASTFFVFSTCTALLLTRHNVARGELHRPATWLWVCCLQTALLLMAAVGAYSRVYLSQHFLSDIFAGSIIGFATPLLIYHFGRNKLFKFKDL